MVVLGGFKVEGAVAALKTELNDIFRIEQKMKQVATYTSLLDVAATGTKDIEVEVERGRHVAGTSEPSSGL